MSFLKGPVTARRFSCAPFGLPSEEHVAALRRYPASLRWNPDGKDDVTYAWTGGLDRLDATLAADKQVRGEFLTFGFLVTTRKVPADLLKARARVELAALTGGGAQKATAKLKREAKQAALDALADEAKDGRYDRFTHVPVVVDCERGAVWFGHSSHAHLPAFEKLFLATFGVEASAITPGHLGGEVPDYPGDLPAWVADGEAGDGWAVQWAAAVVRGAMGGQDEFPGEGGNVTLMPHKALVMQCPAGRAGEVSCRDDMPHRMPEAVRAVGEGKLPYSLGLAASWAGLAEPVTFTVRPHDWVVTGADVDEPESADPAVREAGRLLACREFFDTLDGILTRYLGSIPVDVVPCPDGHQE